MLKGVQKPADAAASGTSGELGALFELSHGLVSREVLQYMACTMHGEEMSFSQLNTIFRLNRSGPQTIAQIAEGADLTHNAASRMVERLTQSGLVERREDSTDRRQKQVEITKKGIKRLKDLQAVTVKAYAALFVNVPAPLRDRLAGILLEVRAFLPMHPMAPEGTADKTPLPRAAKLPPATAARVARHLD
jgi:DNA-binding MarR family transcriptional regulator